MIDTIQIKRNECLNLLRIGNRKINEIRWSNKENSEHWMKKESICRRLTMEGRQFITEAIFNKGGRADILCLDNFTAYMIVNTESIESINKKRKLYPKGINLIVVRV